MISEITNDRGVTIKVGQVWFMSSPASKRWPRTFPESSWMFIVISLNECMAQGYSVNWKRKGKGTWVSRTLDEFNRKLIASEYLDEDGYHGLRLADEKEKAYFFKRAPEYKKYQEVRECE